MRKPVAITAVTAAIVASSLLGLSLFTFLTPPAAAATVVTSFSPGYPDSYVPNYGWLACNGFDDYHSSTSASTGQVSGGSQVTNAIYSSSCTSNTGERIHGGGFHVNSAWSPSSSGTYYLVADWTYNAIQYAANFFNCVHGSASVQVDLIIAAWDVTTSSNVFFWDSQVLSISAINSGWCPFSGVNGILGSSPGGTTAFGSTSTSSVYLYSTHAYQFRSNVNFQTDVDCSHSKCSSGDGASAEFNVATNYVWTLNWLNVDQ